MTFQKIIYRLLEEEISITLFIDEGVLWHDLNTGMKSHLHISDANGSFKYRGRYNETGEFETFDDLMNVVSNCRCGRTFANDNWRKLLLKLQLWEAE